MKIHKYEAGRYQLADAVQNIYGVANLAYLHDLLGDAHMPCLEFRNDQKTFFHKVFYANKDWQFMPRFEKLVREVVPPLVGEPFLYQKVPTFRVQLPNNISVGQFHCDADYGHSPDEANFYLPLTDAHTTSTIWAESEPRKGDYKPFPPVTYGEMIEWNGANLVHGNKINETGFTRVSVDFRILPLRLYDEADGMKRQTTHVKKRFVIGEYFALCE